GTAAAARNLISGNGFNPLVGPGSGILITDPGTQNNLVQGNYLGTDITGTRALGNALGGVVIFAGPTGNTLAGNLISGNGDPAVAPPFGDGVITRQASGNVVQGNYVGTDGAGQAPLGNRRNGILLDNASDNLIGGFTPGSGNLISANPQNGLE